MSLLKYSNTYGREIVKQMKTEGISTEDAEYLNFKAAALRGDFRVRLVIHSKDELQTLDPILL